MGPAGVSPLLDSMLRVREDEARGLMLSLDGDHVPRMVQCRSQGPSPPEERTAKRASHWPRRLGNRSMSRAPSNPSAATSARSKTEAIWPTSWPPCPPCEKRHSSKAGNDPPWHRHLHAPIGLASRLLVVVKSSDQTSR